MPSPYYPGKHVTNVQSMLVNILIIITIKIKCLCVNRGSNNKCNIASSYFLFTGKPTPESLTQVSPVRFDKDRGYWEWKQRSPLDKKIKKRECVCLRSASGPFLAQAKEVSGKMAWQEPYRLTRCRHLCKFFQSREPDTLPRQVTQAIGREQLAISILSTVT